MPIFEVILPFTTEAQELIMLLNYYKKAIIGHEDTALYESITTKEWIGTFNPKSIKVIPLVEDFNSIINVDKIVRPYLQAVKPRQQRVFIARSDPALNYGLICAVLLSKNCLKQTQALEKQQDTLIYPILGVGSKPFRGHLSPENIDNFLEEYKGLSTVTVQSAFRYDYPTAQVKEGVETFNQRLPNGEPETISQQKNKFFYQCSPNADYIMNAKSSSWRLSLTVFQLTFLNVERENFTSDSSATADVLQAYVCQEQSLLPLPCTA